MGPHRGHPSPEAEAIDRGLGLGIGPGGHLLHSCCGLASCCCFAGAERASEPASRRASRSLRRYPRQTYHHVCFRVTLVGSSIHQPVMRYVRAPSQLRTSGRTPRPKRQNKRTQAKNTRLSRDETDDFALALSTAVSNLRKDPAARGPRRRGGRSRG